MKRKKIKVAFKVDPEELRDNTYVPDGIKVVIINPCSTYLFRVLGESGWKLAVAGISFWFTRKIAVALIKAGTAVRV